MAKKSPGPATDLPAPDTGGAEDRAAVPAEGDRGSILDGIMHSDRPADPAPPDPALAAGRPASPRRRGGFFGTFLGGVAAAALGFGGAVWLLPRLPAGWAPYAPTQADLPVQVKSLGDRIESLSAEVAALQERPDGSVDSARIDAELSQLRDQIAGLPAAAPDLGPVEARLKDLDARLGTLEKRPVGGGAASATAIDAFARDLAALRERIDSGGAGAGAQADRIAAAAAAAEEKIKAATAEADRLRAEAAEAVRRTTAQSAARMVSAAIDSGAPFTAALDDLAAAGVPVSPDLTAQASGVPTLAALRAGFPDAARAALSVSARPAENGGMLERLDAFLRNQTGARSLTPREGSDPDAVLSRAEAALAKGDLSATLDELQALPPEGQQAMAGWIAEARARQTAANAATALLAAVK